MENELTQKADKIYARFLNQRGTVFLTNKLVIKDLIMQLSDEDIDQLIEYNIFFNPVPSPASQCRINQSLPQGALVITVDTNATEIYTGSEITAMILHEIGHAMNPRLSGMVGEYAADDYAADRGFKAAILSSLTKAMEIDPAHFVNQSTHQRIERLVME